MRDLRKVPDDLDVPTGANLDTKAHVVLTVGSDCALGKMTVCLELDRETRRRGHASVFVPTGQTGIAIAGWGIAVDQVVSDFVAGAAEQLVVDGHARGGDGALLWIEGQGSLNHPYYSGVTLGLLHGSAPHAMVFVHEPGRELIEGDPRYPIRGLAELIDDQIRMARHVRPGPGRRGGPQDEQAGRGGGAHRHRPDRARDRPRGRRSGAVRRGADPRRRALVALSAPRVHHLELPGLVSRPGARPPTDQPGEPAVPLLARGRRGRHAS